MIPPQGRIEGPGDEYDLRDWTSIQVDDFDSTISLGSDWKAGRWIRSPWLYCSIQAWAAYIFIR